jgi:hypothetical protein
MKIFAHFLALFFLTAATAAAEDTTKSRGQILSAFFGLDDSWKIRVRTFLACRSASGRDGMPVIFSHEIDDTTLDAEDFRVTTASAKVGRVKCVTLRPANELGERRTVLVIGEFGSADDQPVQVEIVGELMSLEGGVNFRGKRVDVIPLESGPTMILAETVPPKNWSLGGRGNCPGDGIKSIVRITWVGGITKPGGDEIDEREMQLYRVTARHADGTVESLTPVAVGDLNDNDNNHELCLGVDAEPLSVFFPAGVLTDPNEDLNPDTEVTVSPNR